MLLWLSRVKGLQRAESRLVRLLALALALAMHFILLITTMGRKPAICNRLQPQKHVDSFASKAAEQDPPLPIPLSFFLPLPVALSLLSTNAIIDLICNCFMSGKIRDSICMTNSQCNLPIKLDACPAVSPFLSLPLLSLSVSLFHCPTVHHERILSNNNRSMSIIIIL